MEQQASLSNLENLFPLLERGERDLLKNIYNQLNQAFKGHSLTRELHTLIFNHLDNIFALSDVFLQEYPKNTQEYQYVINRLRVLHTMVEMVLKINSSSRSTADEKGQSIAYILDIYSVKDAFTESAKARNFENRAIYKRLKRLYKDILTREKAKES